MSGNGQSHENSPREMQPITPLQPLERLVVNELQQDLPLIARPFDAIADKVGMEIAGFLSCCRLLKDKGIMRRFGASIQHYNAGFVANAMVCWTVPSSKVEGTGKKMATFKEVSHCYERKTNQSWPYNIFTMIHGRTKEDCQNTAERISQETGINEYKSFFTSKEFKKERVRYRLRDEEQQSSRYYPVFLDIKGKRCVVIGGGKVAWRKVTVLLEHEASVEVISPQMCSPLNEMAANGTLMATLRKYRSGDLQGAFVVVAATADSETNEQVAKEAMERGILINVVDVPKLSNFIVPSYLRRGDVTIAVSTGGKSPALARKIRTELEQRFGDEYATLASLADEVRSELKQRKITVPADTWQQALDIDVLTELLRLGHRDQAKKRLLAVFEKGK